MFVSLFVVSYVPCLFFMLTNWLPSSYLNVALPIPPQASFYLKVVASNIVFLANVADPLFILRNRDVRETLPQITWLPSFWYCVY